MPRRPKSRVPGNAAALTDEALGNRAYKTPSYYANLGAQHSRVTDLALDPDRPPWEKQPRETDRQYAYFLQYRDTPPYSRSIVGLAAIVGRDSGYLSVLNRSLHWGERVLAWDTEQRRKYELELDERRKQLISQHLRVQDAMFRIILTKIATMSPDAITARDIGPMITSAGDLGRKALGMDDKQGPKISVQAQAVSAAAAKAVSAAEGQQEARAMMESIMANMDRMVDAMTPEQRAEALETWEAAGIIDGETVET